MTNKAAVLQKKGTPFVVEDRTIPQPQAHEILVKNHAIATNPADYKMQDIGIFIDSYPTVLGSDVAGTVEAVGSAVTGFQLGDPVSGFGDVLITHDSRSAAFQQYTIVKDVLAVKVPDSLSFKDAATLPMTVATAGLAIFLTLGVPRSPAKQSGSVFLVWGGAGAVGTGAVQIARALGFTVYAVNSPKNDEYVKKLGATACFDYRDPDVEAKILSALKAAGLKIDYALDAISEHGTQQKVASVVSASSSGGKVATVLDYPADQPKPANVQVDKAFAARLATDQKDLSRWLFNDWLQGALRDGTYVPSPPVRELRAGVEAIQEAVDMHRKGVSGVKLVVPL